MRLWLHPSNQILLLTMILLVTGPAAFFILAAAYAQWWPYACALDQKDILRLPETPYLVRDTIRDCGIIYEARQDVDIVNTQTGETARLFKVRETEAPFSVLFRNGVIHVVFADYRTPWALSWHGLGFAVKYHWIPDGNRPNDDFAEWKYTPHDPDYAAWALAHSRDH